MSGAGAEELLLKPRIALVIVEPEFELELELVLELCAECLIFLSFDCDEIESKLATGGIEVEVGELGELDRGEIVEIVLLTEEATLGGDVDVDKVAE